MAEVPNDEDLVTMFNVTAVTEVHGQECPCCYGPVDRCPLFVEEYISDAREAWNDLDRLYDAHGELEEARGDSPFPSYLLDLVNRIGERIAELNASDDEDDEDDEDD